MIPARFLPARVCRWLRERRMRQLERMRARDCRARRARWMAQYLVSINVRSTFR